MLEKNKNILANGLILIVACLITVRGFSPYFFGDEIFVKAGTVNVSTWTAIIESAKYKPRIIFNSILVLLFKFGFPRYIFAGIYIAALFSMFNVIYKIHANIFRESLLKFCFVVLVVGSSLPLFITSFDYISGLLEVVALLIFSTYLYYILRICCGHLTSPYPSICLNVLLYGLLLTLFNERYWLPFAIVAIYMYFNCKNINTSRYNLIALLTCAVLPACIYFILNYFLSSYSVFTAGGATPIKFDFESINLLNIALFNVFLGGHLGPSWLWGQFYNTWIGTFAQCLSFFVLLYILFVFVFKRTVLTRCSYLFLVLIISFVIEAISAGPLRQEPRFLLAPITLSLVLYSFTIKGRHFYIPALSLLLINAMYFFNADYYRIAHIKAQYISRSISELLNYRSDLNNKFGILYGAIDDDWWEGSNPLVFTELNVKTGAIIQQSFTGLVIDRGVDFAINIDRYSSKDVPYFSYVSDRLLKFLNRTPSFYAANDRCRQTSPVYNDSGKTKLLSGKNYIQAGESLLLYPPDEFILPHAFIAFYSPRSDGFENGKLVVDAFDFSNNRIASSSSTLVRNSNSIHLIPGDRSARASHFVITYNASAGSVQFNDFFFCE